MDPSGGLRLAPSALDWAVLENAGALSWLTIGLEPSHGRPVSGIPPGQGPPREQNGGGGGRGSGPGLVQGPAGLRFLGGGL